MKSIKSYKKENKLFIYIRIESYLKNRYQFVQIGTNKSQYINIKCGVPQGSILGPILFILYINDLPNASETLEFQMFADDTVISIKGKDPNLLTNLFNEELKNIVNWLKHNKLILNLNKTKCMYFHTPRPKKLDVKRSIVIDGFNIEKVESFKYLGIAIDEHLNWKSHIDNLATKLNKSLAILRKIRIETGIKPLRSIYYALFNSIAKYGILAWGNCAPTHIEKLQKKCIKLTKNALDPEKKILSIRDQYVYSLVMYFFKSKMEVYPTDLWIDLKIITKQTIYETRSKTPYLPKIRTNYGKRAASYYYSKFFNIINELEENNKTTSKFKKCLIENLPELIKTL